MLEQCPHCTATFLCRVPGTYDVECQECGIIYKDADKPTDRGCPLGITDPGECWEHYNSGDCGCPCMKD